MIELTCVTKSYYKGTSAQINALRNVNLKINKGEMVAVIGASGSGKSTLLNIIGCLDVPDEGECYLNGKQVNNLSQGKLSEIRNKQIGFVLQDFGLMLDRTVYRNLSYPLIFNSNIKSKQFKELSKKALESVGLSSRVNSKCIELSGGQKQRVAIARAIINDPDIILADEPTGALDTKISEEIMELFKYLNQQGKTVVIVTHDSKIAEQCDRIIKISDGSIIL